MKTKSQPKEEKWSYNAWADAVCWILACNAFSRCDYEPALREAITEPVTETVVTWTGAAITKLIKWVRWVEIFQIDSKEWRC